MSLDDRAAIRPIERPQSLGYDAFVNIEIISRPITVEHLRGIADSQFGDMVKAVVDIEDKIMAIGGELHADEEAELLARGSRQENLWGINLYVDEEAADWLEFDSMINVRPSQANKSRSVEDPALRARIADVVNELVPR